MINKDVFDALIDKGIITNVGLKPADFKDINELMDYGFATSVAAQDVYTSEMNKLDVSKVIEDFLADIAEGGKVILSYDLSLDAPVVINKDVIVDLNGYTIKSKQDVFEVKSGSLTINGNGLVHAATDNTCSYCAVWAYGDSIVTINGGTYMVGAPEGDYNDLIYAKDNAKITINDGCFHSAGTVRANDNVSFMLNLKDNTNADIKVFGGKFELNNPSDAKTEPGGAHNFVADGYESVADGNWYVVRKAESSEIVVDDTVTE